jgi:hypothetical protein
VLLHRRNAQSMVRRVLGVLAGVNPEILRNMGEAMVAASRDSAEYGRGDGGCLQSSPWEGLAGPDIARREEREDPSRDRCSLPQPAGESAPPLLVFPGPKRVLQDLDTLHQRSLWWRSAGRAGRLGECSGSGASALRSGSGREGSRWGCPRQSRPSSVGQCPDSRELGHSSVLGGEAHRRGGASPTSRACNATDRRVPGASIPNRLSPLALGLRQRGCSVRA